MKLNYRLVAQCARTCLAVAILVGTSVPIYYSQTKWKLTGDKNIRVPEDSNFVAKLGSVRRCFLENIIIFSPSPHIDPEVALAGRFKNLSRDTQAVAIDTAVGRYIGKRIDAIDNRRIPNIWKCKIVWDWVEECVPTNVLVKSPRIGTAFIFQDWRYLPALNLIHYIPAGVERKSNRYESSLQFGQRILSDIGRAFATNCSGTGCNPKEDGRCGQNAGKNESSKRIQRYWIAGGSLPEGFAFFCFMAAFFSGLITFLFFLICGSIRRLPTKNGNPEKRCKHKSERNLAIKDTTPHG